MTDSQDRDVVLIVEDEPVTMRMVSHSLTKDGLRVLEAGTIAEARRLLAAEAVDLALVDIGLPDGSGMELAREIRRGPDIGLIFMTLMAETEDRVLGLEIGADDYVTKPIELRELSARVRNTLRRVRRPAPKPDDGVVKLGSWEIDLRRREAVAPDGSLAPLTQAEFDMVAALVQADGRPVSRDYLLDVVSRRSETIGDRTVDTLISRVRQKLDPEGRGPALILTERGVGYRAVLDGG